MNISKIEKSYKQRVQDAFRDPSTSEWLKRAILVCNGRDIVDVLNDVEFLYDLMKVKLDECFEHEKQKG